MPHFVQKLFSCQRYNQLSYPREEHVIKTEAAQPHTQFRLVGQILIWAQKSAQHLQIAYRAEYAYQREKKAKNQPLAPSCCQALPRGSITYINFQSDILSWGCFKQSLSVAVPDKHRATAVSLLHKSTESCQQANGCC